VAGEDTIGKRERRLSPAAARYLVVVATAAIALTVSFLPRIVEERGSWLTFAVLAALAVISQLLMVQVPASQSYSTTTVFFVAAALLLPPELVVLTVAVAHVAEWLKYRYRWFIQTFNVCNYVIAALAAWAVAHFGLRFGPSFGGGASLAVLGLLAAATFVFLNHGMLAEMLRRARGHSYRESGLFGFENFTTDLVLAALGVCLAGLWDRVPALAVFAVAPLVLIHRSLSVPQLEAEARLDPKTGLYNARHLEAALHEEVERAERFQRPFSVLVADLDLLRDVNNSYGHLAGDAVLKTIADIFKQTLRSYDVPTRFGGEEFAILLPETATDNALHIAERIRSAVAATLFRIPGHDKTISVTISIGVASYASGESTDDVMHRADLALYQAKSRGRNRVSLLALEGVEAARSTAALPATIHALHRMRPARGSAPMNYSGPERRDRMSERVALQFPAKLARLARAPEHRGEARSEARSPAVLAFIAAVFIAAAVVFGASLPGLDDALRRHPVELAVFGALTLFLQLFSVPLHGRGSVTVSGIGLLSTGFLLGPGAAALVGALAGISMCIRMRPPLYRGTFDVSNLVLSAAAGAATYHVLVSHLPWAGAGPASAFVAGATYAALNVGVVASVMALSESRSPVSIWNERFSWGVLHYFAFGPLAYASLLAYQRLGVTGLLAFALPPLLLMVSMRQYLERTRRSAEEVRAANAELELANRELAESRTRLHRTHLATIAALSKSMEAKDSNTSEHTERVAALAVLLAERLGYAGEELEAIELGALLHDIGKIGVPEYILQKAGPLDESEWDQIRRHPVVSEYILTEVDLHPIVTQIVRSSHERIDGTGYPDGLTGNEIPLPARIVLVADAFDALTSQRPYRAAQDLEQAWAEIKAHAGTQFCRVVVAALETLLPEEQAPGEMGIRLSRQSVAAAAG
jgi:diguanylate cyclase (GGDEF)-like protein/putative nucleotidyltransferase with HDIG domain